MPYRSNITHLRIEEEARKHDQKEEDTGASCLVYHDLNLFRKYSEIKDKNILLEDHHTTKLADVGEVELKFTSGKVLVLKKVLHTLGIRKNLVFGYLLYKAGFSQTIGSNLFTLTKNNAFVGNGYKTEGMLIKD